MIRRVELRNYRGIEHCDVALGPLMFLVGPNASGKSNFLDALRFVSDCLNTSVDQAIRVRGGFKQLCRQGSGNSFSLRLTTAFGNLGTAEYVLEIAAGPTRSFEIAVEDCRLTGVLGSTVEGYERRRGSVAFSFPLGIDLGDGESNPPQTSDRLYLGALAGWPMFGLIYRFLSTMAFYNPLTIPMREYQSQDPGSRLTSNASNLASVFRTMRETHPDWAERIIQYLTVAVPRLRKVVDVEVGERITLRFTEASIGGPERTFYASSMSDGTLRMLAILLAIFQRSEQDTSLVGIEEPELGVHPAAAEVLYDSLETASRLRQVLVTTHSSELLERDDVDLNSILAFSAEGDSTLVEPLDDTVRSILQQKLSTPGEMLRKDLLGPQRFVAR